ncbi:hypothetical protein [Streptomyces sp. NPDC020917]
MAAVLITGQAGDAPVLAAVPVARRLGVTAPEAGGHQDEKAR